VLIDDGDGSEAARRRAADLHVSIDRTSGEDSILIFQSNPEATVTFYIGEDAKVFVVHKEFACHYSPVLRAAFNSNFMEGKTQTYTLKGTTEELFRLFVDWLYRGKFHGMMHEGDDPVNTSDKIERKKLEQRLSTLAELWVLCEKLLVRSLQNLVIDQAVLLTRKHLFGPRIAVVNYISENAPQGSALWRFVVDLRAWYLRCGSDEEIRSKVMTEFDRGFQRDMFRDIVTALAIKPHSTKQYPLKASDYHVKEEHV